MSKLGAPDLRVPSAPSLRVAVIAASWHEEIMHGLVNGAKAALVDTGNSAPLIVRVPGTFELTAAARCAAVQGYEALVCLGVVVRGETPHFDYVCSSVTQGLTHITAQTGVPIGFGVLTCDTVAQALARAGLPGSKEDKGYEAALAAVSTAMTLAGIPGAADR